jgi:hypothetical protein
LIAFGFDFEAPTILIGAFIGFWEKKRRGLLDFTDNSEGFMGWEEGRWRSRGVSS